MNLSRAVALLLLFTPLPLFAMPKVGNLALCTRSATLLACQDGKGNYYSVRSERGTLYLRGYDSASRRLWAQTNSRFGAMTFFTGLASDGEAWVGYSHRVGSSKRIMSAELLARLFQQRSMARLIRFDEQLLPGSSREAIDPELKARFLRGDLPETLQLKKLYLLREDENHQLCLTVTGALLLTRRPADLISSAIVQCVAYSGTERNAEYQVDAQDCDGPLDEQIQQAFNFVKRNMRVEAVKRPGRIDIPQYDLGAVYEAVVNAVAHRDYAMHGARIRLHLFSDRLEISTPGGLPNSLTVDSMDANSISRNETLVNLLSRYYPADPSTRRQNMIERRGEGVPTIISASERLSLRRPLYQQTDNTELKLTIYAASRARNGLLAQFAEDEDHADD